MKKNITYRAATIDDVPFMTEMLLEACVASGVAIALGKLSEHPDTEIYIRGWSPDAEGGAIAETDSGMRVGAAWIRNLPGLGHTAGEQLPELTIAVHPDFRREGVADGLMNKLYELALQKGIRKLSLGVHRDNAPAIRLYEKHGWVREDEFKEYIMMGREL